MVSRNLSKRFADHCWSLTYYRRARETTLDWTEPFYATFNSQTDLDTGGPNLRRSILLAGICLIIVSLVLGGVQDLNIYNIYVSSSNKWYFYAAITGILVIGIILAVWCLLKKETKKQGKTKNTEGNEESKVKEGAGRSLRVMLADPICS